MAFIPAFPKMRRTTQNGIHYIDGVPVAGSVFGQDPFEPIRKSDIRDILAEQTQVPVVLHSREESSASWASPGIQVYDAGTNQDLRRIGLLLGPERLRLSAGCAGFAEPLADVLGLGGKALPLPRLEPSLFIACGSVNPVTLRQMAEAENAGFSHIHLTPVQKLEPAWLETPECEERVRAWLSEAAAGRFILDVNDPAGRDDTAEYARARGLTTEDLRVRISGQLARLTQRLLDGGLNATMLCTGGDTLLALMRAVGVSQLTPICEVSAGAVLTNFVYQGKSYHIISKSGGFGEPGLFCKLAALVGAGNQKEDALC